MPLTADSPEVLPGPLATKPRRARSRRWMAADSRLGGRAWLSSACVAATAAALLTGCSQAPVAHPAESLPDQIGSPPSASASAEDPTPSNPTTSGAPQASDPVEPIPIPALGDFVIKSYSEPTPLPAFPEEVPGFTLAEDMQGTTRVFDYSEWETVTGFRPTAANDCAAYRWFVRWESTNPDVTIRSGVGIVPMDAGPIGTEKAGRAGYLASSSCMGPEFAFGKALGGNESNLADVAIEWQIWETQD